MSMFRLTCTGLALVIAAQSAFADGSQSSVTLRAADAQKKAGWIVTTDGSRVRFDVCQNVSELSTCREDFQTSVQSLENPQKEMVGQSGSTKQVTL